MRRKIGKKFSFIILMMMVLTITGCTKEHEDESVELSEAALEDTKEEESDKTMKVQEDGEDEIFVHVCGEVAHPGVYSLRAGSRLYEVIEAAGGMTDAAAGESLNQAAWAEDGQQIYVPSKEEVMQERTVQGTESQNLDDGKINLNTASKEELMTLNGIGEAKATAIITYREEHGGFQTVEELMEVEGIKEGVFNKVKDQIKI